MGILRLLSIKVTSSSKVVKYFCRGELFTCADIEGIQNFRRRVINDVKNRLIVKYNWCLTTRQLSINKYVIARTSSQILHNLCIRLWFILLQDAFLFWQFDDQSALLFSCLLYSQIEKKTIGRFGRRTKIPEVESGLQSRKWPL